MNNETIMRVTTKLKRVLRDFDMKLSLKGATIEMELTEKVLGTPVFISGRTFGEVSDKAFKLISK